MQFLVVCLLLFFVILASFTLIHIFLAKIVSGLAFVVDYDARLHRLRFWTNVVVFICQHKQRSEILLITLRGVLVLTLVPSSDAFLDFRLE